MDASMQEEEVLWGIRVGGRQRPLIVKNDQFG